VPKVPAKQIVTAVPVAIGNANTAGSSNGVALADHVHAHGSQTDPSHHAISEPNGAAGFMSGAQALKLLYVPYLAGSPVSTVGVANDAGVSTTHCAPFDHVHAHGDHSTPSMHAVATPSANGFMSSADKALLNLYEAEALVQNQSPLMLRSVMRPGAGAPTGTTNNLAYCLYIGYTTKQLTINHTRFYQSSAGVGADNGCQMGFGSSPAGPSLSAFATVTPLAIAAIPSPLTPGNKANAVAFGVVVAAGTHLWAIVKSAMATTQLGVYPVIGDVTGAVQSRSAAGTLAVSTPIVCTAYASSAPDMTLQAA
jgi:hypothetical protein